MFTGYPEVVIDAETQLENGVVKKRSPKSNYSNGLLGTIFPCSGCSKKLKQSEGDKQENNETKDKLLIDSSPSPSKDENLCGGKNINLQPHEAGAIYRERPSPSAPVIDETGNLHVVVSLPRAMSFPIQASS